MARAAASSAYASTGTGAAAQEGLRVSREGLRGRRKGLRVHRESLRVRWTGGVARAAPGACLAPLLRCSHRPRGRAPSRHPCQDEPTNEEERGAAVREIEEKGEKKKNDVAMHDGRAEGSRHCGKSVALVRRGLLPCSPSMPTTCSTKVLKRGKLTT